MSISMKSSKAQMYSEIERLRAECDRLRASPSAPVASLPVAKVSDARAAFLAERAKRSAAAASQLAAKRKVVDAYRAAHPGRSFTAAELKEWAMAGVPA